MTEHPKRYEEPLDDGSVDYLSDSEILAAEQHGRDDVKAGRVVPMEEAMRMLREDLDSHLQQGLDDLKNGRVMSLDEAFHRLHAELGLKSA